MTTSPKMDDSLLPCPFCGGKARQQLHYADGDMRTQPYLAACCEAHTDWITVEQWNRRALRQDSSGGAGEDHPAIRRLMDLGHQLWDDGLDQAAKIIEESCRALAAPQESRSEVLEQAAQCIEPSSGLSEDGTLLIRKAQAAIRSLKIKPRTDEGEGK